MQKVSKRWEQTKKYAFLVKVSIEDRRKKSTKEVDELARNRPCQKGSSPIVSGWLQIY
jgi:hypothetical protein